LAARAPGEPGRPARAGRLSHLAVSAGVTAAASAGGVARPSRPCARGRGDASRGLGRGFARTGSRRETGARRGTWGLLHFVGRVVVALRGHGCSYTRKVSASSSPYKRLKARISVPGG